MRLFGKSVPATFDRALRACGGHFVLAAVLSALVNLLYLAPTIYMMQVYDRVVPTSGLLTLLYITIVVAIAIATLAALDAVRSRVMVRSSMRVNRMVAPLVLDRLMARDRTAPGQAASSQAMREFDGLCQAMGGPAAIALFDVPWTPLYLLVAFLIHPLLGALVLCAGIVLVALAVTNERGSRRANSAAHAATAQAYGSQEASFRQSEIVRALGMRRALVNRHVEERQRGSEASSTVQFSASRYNALVKFVRMLMQSVALGAGAYLAVKGQISVGAIMAASVLLSRALQPIEQLVGMWSTVTQSRQAIETLHSLFEGADDAASPRTALPDPLGHVELDRVVVRDPSGSAMLLRNVSLKLTPGQLLGVIGPSGAGKTTLARIVAGALPVDLGEVRIDGAGVQDWDPEALARHIGYLPQDCALLPGTVSENVSRFALARGAPREIVDAEVIAAARAAGVHELILRLPAGYDTPLETGAHRLSAGQAQRVALARALYGRPRILVLDEPNSALDGEGEQALNLAVQGAKAAGAAVMIVAHRAAILAKADTLLVLAEGVVARFGPRDEVLAALNEAANVVPINEGRTA